MSPHTIDQLARRIGEHATRHRPERIQVVLHGGEPLLAGHEVVDSALRAVRAAVPGHTELQFSMQTNGILLDEEFLEIFHRHGVRVGVSVDGDAAANDRHRIYANGRGSFDRVAAGLSLLMRDEHRDVYGGLLCTVDLRNDPVSVYESLMSFRPPAIDLLLPHGNWTNPPPQGDGTRSYAQWLIAVFDAWFDGPPERTRIRIFESIIARLLGAPSNTEAIGGEVPGIVVVETDGSYEQSDALKTTFSGGPATGLHLTTESLDDVLDHLGVAAPVRLSQTCQDCRLVAVCGGGLRAHRYRAGNGFDNPSVYCADLLAVIDHVRDRVHAALATRQSSKVLTAAQFAAIASGYGGADAMRVLARGQLAKRKTLLAMVLDAARRTQHDAQLEAAADLLQRAERHRPDAVAQVLALPHVDAWATLCLQRLSDGATVDDLQHLSALAVAAGHAAGIDVDLSVPTLGGVACIPGLGAATGLGAGPVRATGSGTALRFVAPDGTVVHLDGPGWQQLRTVRLGLDYDLVIEDQDPYRNCYQWQPLSHLTDSRADGFTKLLADAWELITREHPAHAVAIQHSVRSVVPLATPPAGTTISASSSHAYGAIAVSIPDTAAELALLLIHEYMHAKLGGLSDLCELHDREQTHRYQAPWRLDPRPAGPLLQGIYAHAGVTDFWRRRRLAPDADSHRAHAQFAYWRAQNTLAVEELRAGGELTDAGHRFVDLLAATLAEWDKEPVPSKTATEVGLFVLAQGVRWRLMNCRPEPDETAAVLDALDSGAALGPVRRRGTMVASDAPRPADAPGLLQVMHRWLGGDTTVARPDGAALALMSGDAAGAAESYLRQLDSDSNDHEAWMGLAVARRLAAGSAPPDPADRLLADRPDLLFAAVSELRSRSRREPASLIVRWLAGSATPA